MAIVGEGIAGMDEEQENVTRLFRTLQGVAMIEGASIMKSGNFEKTIYTSGYSAETATVHWNTYEGLSIASCSLRDHDLTGSALIVA